ncbi:hypothetical protein [Hymenobacter sp. 102]|uniref:hypothetical protein n=1 Tax=Hymenobacter sp. 102 TaxID=3403152 RepID=UPI003CEFE226
MKRKKLLLLPALGLLLIFCWLTPVRPRILAAYTDSFAGIWALDLYKDGGFHLSLPAAEAAGRFRLMGDTILLHYFPSAPQLPAAFLISPSRKNLDELKQVAGRWTITDSGNRMQIQEDSVRWYRHE